MIFFMFYPIKMDFFEWFENLFVLGSKKIVTITSKALKKIEVKNSFE